MRRTWSGPCGPVSTPDVADEGRESTLPLTLCFKGARDYLQGGDVCEAIASMIVEQFRVPPTRFKVSCHGFLRSQPDALLRAGPGPVTEGDRVTFSCQAGDVAVNGVLRESTRAVGARRPFDEQALWSCLAGDTETVEMNGEGPWPASEVMVSMTKKLHHDRFGTQGVRWIFTRLAVDRWFVPGDSSHLRVRFRDDLHGRLTRSELWSGPELLGSVFFSALRS